MTEDWKKYVDYVSVSQVKNHDRSARKWALEKLLKLPTCGSAAMELGSEIHEALELCASGFYTQEILGTMTDTYGEISRRCVKEFSENCDVDLTYAEFEVGFTQVVSEKVPPFKGFIDIYVPDYKGHPMIMDHKTSKTKKYFLDVDGLKNDAQMMVYAFWALNQNPTASGVWLQHNQFAYSLKRKVYFVTRTFVSAGEVLGFMHDLVQDLWEGILKTISKYDEGGQYSIADRSGCRACNNAYGPNSCEFNPICTGVCSIPEYKEAYKEASKDLPEGSRPHVKDLKDKIYELAAQKDLPEKEEDVIIKQESKEGGTMSELKSVEETNLMIVHLSVMMRKARERYKGLINIWDRRDAMTQAIFQYLEHYEKEPKDFIVLLPSHMRERVAPDYEPVVTLLRERGYVVAIEV